MPHSSSDQTIFITGATGMVGARVLAELLNHGLPCATVVRNKGAQKASERIDELLSRFEQAWSCSLGRPRVFVGDVNQTDLGLDPSAISWITQHCDRVLHSAASLSFSPASESADGEPYRTNLEGTKNVLALFERTELEQFHHISTAYVCGLRSGRVAEPDNDVGQSFANDYERSKLQAESLLQSRVARESLTIYRPSIVIDPIGLTPVSGDRTIYGAFSMYQMLSARFGLPNDGEWFRNLGFRGDERKNLIDVNWIAQAIRTILCHREHHARTYHLTATDGTAIELLDATFRDATQQWLSERARRTSSTAASRSPIKPTAGSTNGRQKNDIDQLAAPFVKTFLPYFRDDPVFLRRNIDDVIATTDLEPPPVIGGQALRAMVQNWSAKPSIGKKRTLSDAGESKQSASATPGVVFDADLENTPLEYDPLVICGYAVRLPGGVDDVDAFENLLYRGESAIRRMPDQRLDRSLYLDPKKGVPGKTYTEIGGCVDPNPLCSELESRIRRLGDFDLTHRQFAHVAAKAIESAGGDLESINRSRAGMFVGHSGGTEDGGALALSTLAEAAVDPIRDTCDSGYSPEQIESVRQDVVAAIRRGRPSRGPDQSPELNAYAAASLAARLIGFDGRREVIDAACSSSLLALHHAASAIHAGRMDIALVGGATYNNVDNLALFSRTHACSDVGSFPFDQRASGLVSSEGYVAIVLARKSVADAAGMSIHATLEGVGISSDGKGKGLWAPRSEGQQLAMRRAASSLPESDGEPKPLNIDYLECHATSTQVGDATELESLTALLGESNAVDAPLPIGSVKSNLGHLLEAAGLVGMVKCLIAMRRGEIPPSINFNSPTKSYQWSGAPLRVVSRSEPWQSRTAERSSRVAAVNAFGIGGLNAHAMIQQFDAQANQSPRRNVTVRDADPIAIVGRGLVLPGAATVSEFAELLAGGRSVLSPPPAGRWPSSHGRPTGINSNGSIDGADAPFTIPHHHGGYVQQFQFNAQKYRIPPKLVANANPAQLMLIEAVRQASEEFDGGTWSVDRKRVGVVVGSMFGGQFSNELQIGLRLPELCRELTRSALLRGWDQRSAEAWADAYHDAVMGRYTALLDETGGFTASTLASRIARTFDLMGGACAVDADEASGGLAVLTAIEQLQSGCVDTVLCGTTQRSMDLVALEQLYRNDRLTLSSDPEDLPIDGSRIFPAEGVAIIVLQRLRDARSAGRKIFGVIQSASESFVTDPTNGRARDAELSRQNDVYSSTQIVKQIGHLGGGHGIVRTIAATLAGDRHAVSNQHTDSNQLVVSNHRAQQSPVTVIETASDGYQVEYQVCQPTQNSTPPDYMTRSNAPTEAQTSAVKTKSVRPAALTREAPITVRLESADRENLARELAGIADRGRAAKNGAAPFDCSVQRFGNPSKIQVAMVGRDESEIAAAAGELSRELVQRSRSGALTRHSAFVRFPHITGNRIGWLFPGQGSQYAAMPESLTLDDATAQRTNESLRRFDTELEALGLQAVSDRIGDPENQLGKDIWWTQLWLLAVGTSLAENLLTKGLRPDVVMGHSFGECTAAWCAGAMSTRQAIEFAKSRSDAVVISGGPRGQLLSVRGEPSQVESVLRQINSPCVITHHNSPQQTVIAGSPESIALAQKALGQAGAASVVIAVPAAFHTPAMQPARDMLAARQSGTQLRPPRFGFLSAIENRYLAEPDAILQNLIEQLVRPVCFSSAIERMTADGAGLLIEVGPSNVLTRLASATLDGKAICLSADDRNLDSICQSHLIDLANEAFTGCGAATLVAPPREFPASATTSSLASSGNHRNGSAPANPDVKAPNRFSVVDVTRRARTRTPEPEQNPTPVSKQVPPAPSMPVDSPMPVAPAAPPRETITATSAQSHAVPTPTPVATASPVGSAQTQNAASGGNAREFLFDLIVDLTGYEPEIIDFDADLEAELGVDSIKKAQLIGELVQWAGLNLTTQDLKLADFQSLSDILALAPKTTPIESQEFAPDSAPARQPSVVEDQTNDVADQSELLKRLMIDLLVDQTGYDEDIIDMHADLESELGVDSIKRAQLLGELEQQYDLPPIQQSELKLSDFPTLASIHAFVMQQLSPPSAEAEKKKPSSLSPESSEIAETSGQDAVKPVVAPLNKPEQRIPAQKIPARGTHRFTLGIREANRRDGVPHSPEFHGPALVVGDNAIADAVIRRWDQSAYPIHQIRSLGCDSLDARLDQIWLGGFTPHLFLTTPHDPEAIWGIGDTDHWQIRRDDALMNPYRVCQRWMQGAIDRQIMAESSLVTILRGGGDFGFNVLDPPAPLRSAESGSMAGLTKAMLIEAWMRGFRDTPMLIVDSLAGYSPDEIVDGAWRELAVPSYDEEVAVAGTQRFAIEPHYRPLPSLNLDRPTRHPLTRGGNWVVAGGGRGITAMTAMELAKRHDLKLQLLGMAPPPQIDAATREHALRDRADLRRCTMKRVQSEGGNPVKMWRQFEKAIEIDITLQSCKEQGIHAVYHSVDVSDAEDVRRTLQAIRDVDGPIHGVIQGAGSGQDARFDRKRADKVDQCLKAKIDGTIALAAATMRDPLEWFVGFGSISGRFGANGHTDYSAANDMLSKLIAGLGRERERTRCLTFHWHAWGDIGMATKPEAKLALDMIGMEFMPAAEGLDHFLSEIECGGDDAEVLITDRRYIRKFFPVEDVDDPTVSPMLAPGGKSLAAVDDTLVAAAQGSSHDEIPQSFAVTLSPAKDLFLKEHLVHSRPTLPMVMAIEMLAEAARLSELAGPGDESRHRAQRSVVELSKIQAIQPLKCLTDDAFAVELVRDQEATRNGGATRWTLTCDLRRRDGRLVQSRRPHFAADVHLDDSPACVETVTAEESLANVNVAMSPIDYLPPDAPIYHGPSLQTLRCIGFQGDAAIGTIVAPSPSHLAGEDRPLSAWVISPATIDAVLYAAGVFAGHRVSKPSLPISIETLELGRLPDPGEPLRVVVRWIDGDESSDGAMLSAVLVGQNRDLIARLIGYRIGWLG